MDPTPEAAGLYVHVPFCARICPYCDFAVTTARRDAHATYVEALLGEVARVEVRWRFDTLYLGGGTPSQLSPSLLERLLEGIRSRLDLDTGTWIALEANPEDLSLERARQWRRLGVQGLSLGVQSFDPAALRFLFRKHTADDGRRSVELARQAGFPWVSLDLIYGLPDDRPSRWRRELDAALELAPDHLSCYQLTVHQGTTFGRWRDGGRLAECDPDIQAALFDLTHDLLADAGYPAYEVSNFARSLRLRSRHNIKYWRHAPYLGLGPSAHSFDGASRWWNLRRLKAWRKQLAAGRSPVAERETLTRRQLALEALLLGLRTADGIDLTAFERRFGVDLVGANRALVDRLMVEEKLILEPQRLRPTRAGLRVADGLPLAFDLGLPAD
jgi:oxygen-independent coproporphyrinogen-3 oxidase